MAVGYEQYCPKCSRTMSYERCAGMVFLECACGYKRLIKDTWNETR